MKMSGLKFIFSRKSPVGIFFFFFFSFLFCFGFLLFSTMGNYFKINTKILKP